MCGRYTLLAPIVDLINEFDLDEADEFAPRFNIAPTQSVPVVRLRDPRVDRTMAVVRSDPGGARRLDVLRWGLIPHWAKDAKFAARAINARAETVATQPAFRDAFRRRRCIVPASGFYEWQKSIENGKEIKQPYYIRRIDDKPLALAGLWERWIGPDGQVVETFTIITTEPNDLMCQFHNRMPVILGRGDYAKWLSPDTPAETLQSLLVPCPSEWLTASRVTRRVNSPRFDDPACLEEHTFD